MPAFRLDSRVALVTGGSSALGSAIAVALAEAGADVAVHDQLSSPDDTCVRVRQAGRQAVPITGRLAEVVEADRLVADVLGTFGRLDVLVNTTGLFRSASALAVGNDEWDDVLALNLSSVFRLCRATARHLIEEGRPGRIINILSVLPCEPGATVAACAAAKGGVAQLTRALAIEWAHHGINVNAITHGPMDAGRSPTFSLDATRAEQVLGRIPAGRLAEPEDVAGAAVFLASPAASYIHGHVLVIDGGLGGHL